MFQDLGLLWFAQHTETIEEFIDLLVQSDDPNNIATQYELAEQVGLDMDILSLADIGYIQNEVNRKRKS